MALATSAHPSLTRGLHFIPALNKLTLSRTKTELVAELVQSNHLLVPPLQAWQHCDCMRVEAEVEHYLCEQCDPRPMDRVSNSPPWGLAKIFRHDGNLLWYKCQTPHRLCSKSLHIIRIVHLPFCSFAGICCSDSQWQIRPVVWCTIEYPQFISNCRVLLCICSMYTIMQG